VLCLSEQGGLGSCHTKREIREEYGNAVPSTTSSVLEAAGIQISSCPSNHGSFIALVFESSHRGSFVFTRLAILLKSLDRFNPSQMYPRCSAVAIGCSATRCNCLRDFPARTSIPTTCYANSECALKIAVSGAVMFAISASIASRLSFRMAVVAATYF
jgi:hypothetical protein